VAHIKVVYHREQSSWWANSPEVPGFHVGGETLEETRHLVREGLPFFLGADQVEYSEVTEKGECVGTQHYVVLGAGIIPNNRIPLENSGLVSVELVS
jgi:predicted RNase H-like HicB family nuclease